MNQWTEITSKDNQHVKLAAKLTSKKERISQGEFLTEGLRLCIDALRAKIKLKKVFVTREWIYKNDVEPLLEAAESGFIISDEIARRLADTQSTQGVFCIFRLPDAVLSLDDMLSARKIVLLSSLQDPGNLGSIIRTAEAFGIDMLVLSSDCPDIYSPKVLRSTMGGTFRIKTAVVPDLCKIIAELKNAGFFVYATALEEKSLPIIKANFDAPSAIVIGNEGNGIPKEIVSECSACLKIPMPGMAESLNAAAAASIAIWEMVRGNLIL